MVSGEVCAVALLEHLSRRMNVFANITASSILLYLMRHNNRSMTFWKLMRIVSNLDILLYKYDRWRSFRHGRLNPDSAKHDPNACIIPESVRVPTCKHLHSALETAAKAMSVSVHPKIATSDSMWLLNVMPFWHRRI